MLKDEVFRVKEGYDIVAEYYRDSKWQHLWSRAERPFVINWLKKLKKGKGIDIGSGNGPYIKDIVGQGHSVVAFDISPRMMEQNEKINNGHNKGLAFVIGDIEGDSKFPDETFDWALCTRVLSNINNLEIAVKNIAKTVKKGGELLITDIHPEHEYDYTSFEIPERTSKSNIIKIKIETYKHHISLLEKELYKNGFREIYLNILRLEDIEKYIDKTRFEKLYKAPKNEILYILKAKKLD